MRTNHLFASAAIAAVLVATAPAQAQPLGGAVHGGFSARQGATFADGFGRAHSGANDEASASTTGRAAVRTQGTERVDTAAKTGEHDSARTADATKDNVLAASHGALQTAASGAAKAETGANSTTAATADSLGRTSVTAAGQGRVQAGSMSAGSEVAGVVSGRGAQNAPVGASSGGKPALTQTSAVNGAVTTDAGTSASVSRGR